jgi:hypothetical protein
MKIKLEMYIDEDDESVLMKKVSELTKHAKEMGFKLAELEFKNREQHNEHDSKRKENKKHHHHGR